LLSVLGRPGDRFVHAGGEPLGPFDPDWALLTAWLGCTGVDLTVLEGGGHATPDARRWMVERVSPQQVFAIHSEAPEALACPAGVTSRVAEKGRWYGLNEA
jgi:hypothetical protein